MKHIGATSALVEIVHILSHDTHYIIFFKFGEKFMSTIRNYLKELSTTLVIKIKYKCWISCKSFG